MINELDLKGLWKELDDYEKELDSDSKVLEEVWLKIAELKAKSEAESKRFVSLLVLTVDNLNSLFYPRSISAQPELTFLEPDIVIGFNIGGQIFEARVEFLIRDPGSILAACCRATPAILPDRDGYFFFERDWWLFRHILSFLRSNILPNELDTLRELYAEASYYRLQSLQIAIENLPVSDVTYLGKSAASLVS